MSRACLPSRGSHLARTSSWTTATSPLTYYRLRQSPSIRRSFHDTSKKLQESSVTAVAPPRKPIGGFRGGIFGFLFGTTLAGAGVYTYILEEYRVSNALLTEDIYALQASIHRVENYTKTLEEQVAAMQKRQQKSTSL